MLVTTSALKVMSNPEARTNTNAWAPNILAARKTPSLRDVAVT